MNESKWNKQFAKDLFERVGSTFIGALLTLVAMDNILEGPDWDTVLWPIVVLPTLISLLKGLLMNMGSNVTPSASLTNVSSNPS